MPKNEAGPKESDLYPPLKTYLSAQGYEVKGEVQGCDVVAIRGKEPPVVIELKLVFNLNVILQAVERIAVSDHIYIGVPRECKSLKRDFKRIVKLLRLLGLGLICIDIHPSPVPVEVVLDPSPYRPRISKRRRQRLLGEFQRRIGDPNLGGTATRKGIMTAYRQRAMAIARYLHESGPCKAAEVAKALHEPKARNIMYRNVYDWFERVRPGVYALTEKGRQALPTTTDGP